MPSQHMNIYICVNVYTAKDGQQQKKWPLRGAHNRPLYGRGRRALMAARPAESRAQVVAPTIRTVTTPYLKKDTNGEKAWLRMATGQQKTHKSCTGVLVPVWLTYSSGGFWNGLLQLEDFMSNPCATPLGPLRGTFRGLTRRPPRNPPLVCEGVCIVLVCAFRCATPSCIHMYACVRVCGYGM